jgi:hypothetical protein
VLRVYLTRPWLVTGDGEQLAVVLDPAGTQTMVGRDPIVPGSTSVVPVTSEDFPRAVSVVAGAAGEPDLVGHAVSFDQASGRWYADIELTDRFGYRPFLRLVVARHQPDSIGGAAVSTPLTLDAVRLGLVRQTTAVRDANAVEVTVSGTDGLGNTVQVSVQQADRTIADDDLRWRPVSDEAEPLAATADEGQTTWSGKIALPTTTDPLRLVIEELEPGRRDEGGAVIDVQTAVFVETVELPLA